VICSYYDKEQEQIKNRNIIMQVWKTAAASRSSERIAFSFSYHAEKWQEIWQSPAVCFMTVLTSQRPNPHRCII
jgi:hypothetical protein